MIQTGESVAPSWRRWDDALTVVSIVSLLSLAVLVLGFVFFTPVP